MPECELLPKLCDVVLHVDDQAPFLAAIQRTSEAPTKHLLIKDRTENRPRNVQRPQSRSVKPGGEHVVIGEHANPTAPELLDVMPAGSPLRFTGDCLCADSLKRQQRSHQVRLLHGGRKQQHRPVFGQALDRFNDPRIPWSDLTQSQFGGWRQTLELDEIRKLGRTQREAGTFENLLLYTRQNAPVL